jgi:hypothetical protein
LGGLAQEGGDVETHSAVVGQALGAAVKAAVNAELIDEIVGEPVEGASQTVRADRAVKALGVVRIHAVAL